MKQHDSGLTAALYVAELRERQARRAAVATATALTEATETANVHRGRLSDELPPSGDTARVHLAAQIRRLRQAAVSEANAAVVEADAARHEALTEWTGHAQRAQLLTKMLERRRQERLLAAQKREQRELDDLAGRPARADEATS